MLAIFDYFVVNDWLVYALTIFEVSTMMVNLFLMLLLFTIICSGLIYQRTRQDIHLMLSIVMAIIFLIWSLAIAHWSVHIFALLALFCLRIPELKPTALRVSDRE